MVNLFKLYFVKFNAVFILVFSLVWEEAPFLDWYKSFLILSGLYFFSIRNGKSIIVDVCIHIAIEDNTKSYLQHLKNYMENATCSHSSSFKVSLHLHTCKVLVGFNSYFNVLIWFMDVIFFVCLVFYELLFVCLIWRFSTSMFMFFLFKLIFKVCMSSFLQWVLRCSSLCPGILSPVKLIESKIARWDLTSSLLVY